MGYSHYFSFNKAPKGQAKQVELKYQKAILECQKIVYKFSQEFGGLSGYTAHTKPGTYGGVLLNGSVETGICEDFVMREHYSQNSSQQFCKTSRYVYDTPVVACLIILKHRLGDLFQVGSDGDTGDWIAGFELALKVTKLKSLRIPATIQVYKVEA